jgi:signal transduction histidine kinase
MHRLKTTPYLFLILLFCLCANFAQGQIQQIRQELHQLSKIKDSVGLVNNLNRLGTLYRTRNADSCFYYGIRAKRIATNIHYQKGQVAAEHVIAFALYKRGLYAESLELLGKILPEYQRLKDVEKITRVYLDMVEVENKGISERKKIISLLQKAIQIGRTLEKDSVMSEVYASYYNRNSNLSADSINYYMRKSREIAIRYKDESMLNFNRLWQARLLILNGQLQAALPLVKQLLSDAQRIGNANMEINVLFLMTGFYDKKPKIALDFLYQAYKVAQKSEDSSLEIYILNNALAVANKLNDKNEIIKVHVKLERAMSAEWERSKKFMGDYIKYNNIQDNNKLLSEENAQRALWILVISFSSAIIVLTVYLIMLRRSRKAKAQIVALNTTANMQIMAMEEAKHQAVKEEQQRLGQDLHDSLASSIAAIKHQLEVLLLSTHDTSLKNKLGMLQMETENAYAAARNKSHEWFSAANEQQEQSFEKQIKLLTDKSLPENHYNKTIHIDNNSLLRVDMDTRISLLRIIQEVITNIIKHAKAKNVGILIYEEDGNLVLTINDDGIGLNEKKSSNEKSTMGLQSIRRRVRSLHGETTIISGSKGTEIVVSIPIV